MVAVAILAAGRGTRMKSNLPKVLHSLAGRSLVERVLDSCNIINPEKIFAIVGYQADLVKKTLAGYPKLAFVEQTEQLGTGHAVQQLLPHLQDFNGDLIVLMEMSLYCDRPALNDYYPPTKPIKMRPPFSPLTYLTLKVTGGFFATKTISFGK